MFSLTLQSKLHAAEPCHKTIKLQKCPSIEPRLYSTNFSPNYQAEIKHNNVLAKRERETQKERRNKLIKLKLSFNCFYLHDIGDKTIP